MATKPTVLILGGTGFIGRNLVKYLVEGDFCSKIRVSDKNKPEMAYFHPKDQEIFANPVVEYVMSNLCNPASVAKAFDLGGQGFDIVIDLATVVPYGQDKETYDQKLIQIAKVCGEEGKKTGIKRWIEVSTAQVYNSNSKASKETDKLKPWTSLAEAKLAAEKVLLDLKLPIIIVRPATVYGPGDVTGIMPRLVCGAVYVELKEEMQFLWTAALQLNTVHVRDVCKALWFLTDHGEIGQIFNLADSAKTNQGSINQLLGEIFHIKTGFAGAAKSNLARLKFKDIVNDVNETHLQPWGEITEKQGIKRTPLSPFLEPELLLNNDLAIDGTLITTLGFTYDVPAPTVDLLREELQYWIDIQAFPPLP